ncbi:MAG: hypothetical protein WAQ00_02570, partial [Tepidanaerobacteraceae bacterium]
YYLDHGETYPEGLDDLFNGGYLNEIPGSFKYEPDDNLKDYSLTPNNTEQGDEQNSGDLKKY